MKKLKSIASIVVRGMVWGGWFVLLVFFIQTALASQWENEPRAALLYWMIVVVLVLGGGIIYLSRLTRED